MRTETIQGAAYAAPVDLRALGRAAIWCTFVLSGFVFIEPAPFDLAIAGLLVIYFLSGLEIPFDVGPMLGLSAVILIGDFIGLSVTAHFKDSTVHVAVTAYLVAVALFLSCLIRRDQTRTFAVIMNGYTVAAILVAAAGIVGYFGVSERTTELFTLYGRARGPFKDPNVFGPFLVVPALYCLHHVFARPARRTLAPLAGFAILMLALLLSLSRGAWGFFVISASIFVLLLAVTNANPVFRLRLAFWSAVAAILAVCVVAVALNVDPIARLIAERAQLVQSYDFGGHGRFDGQLRALEIILVSPFGIGARDFATIWGEEAHNVYLTRFLAGGWIAGLAYLSLVLLTIGRGLALALRPGVHQGPAIILAASLIGVAAEGLIVDTDHWRLFWVLLGMVWGLACSTAPAPAMSDQR